MCSRYEVNSRPRDLARQFGVECSADFEPLAEVRPTDPAPVISDGRLMMLNWGLAVSWDSKPLINARAETLSEKPSFRPLLENRCLVPATAYFEWRKHHRNRLKNRIRPRRQGAFAFAALRDADRFVIITCRPIASITHIHDRMPVILDPESTATWLDPAAHFSEISQLLTPPMQTALEFDETPRNQGDLFDQPPE